MSTGKPDFATAFELMDLDLEDAENRLRAKPIKSDERVLKIPRQPKQPTSDSFQNEVSEVSKLEMQTATRDAESPGSQVLAMNSARRQEPRRSITLKVLAENESLFDRLYHQLQLRGESVNKQDLADQALALLFVKYSDSLN